MPERYARKNLSGANRPPLAHWPSPGDVCAAEYPKMREGAVVIVTHGLTMRLFAMSERRARTRMASFVARLSALRAL